MAKLCNAVSTFLCTTRREGTDFIQPFVIRRLRRPVPPRPTGQRQDQLPPPSCPRPRETRPPTNPHKPRSIAGDPGVPTLRLQPLHRAAGLGGRERRRSRARDCGTDWSSRNALARQALGVDRQPAAGAEIEDIAVVDVNRARTCRARYHGEVQHGYREVSRPECRTSLRGRFTVNLTRRPTTDLSI